MAAIRCDWIAWPVAALFGVIGFSFFIFLTLRRQTSGFYVTVVVFLAALIWGWVGLLADARQITVAAGWQNSVIGLGGEIVRVQSKPGYTRLTLADVRRDDGADLNGRIWLYVYASRQARADFHVGDTIHAQAKLHVPRNRHNPGGFDFKSYCFDRHIALMGSARGQIKRLQTQTSRLELLRQRIRVALDVFPAAQGGVLKALLLGERNDIPVSVYNGFSATGAAHLLAISGLHVGMVAGFGFAIFWWIFTRREAWIVNLPVRAIALLAGVFFALAYATLAAWPLPTQRAVMMLIAAALAWWMRGRVLPLNTLCGALMVILLLDSAAISSLSLWLSFIATACILLWAVQASSDGHNRLMLWGRGLFLVTLVAGLATLPIIAHVFGRLPVYSLPANLLMTPLYTLVVLPLSLLGTLFVAAGLDDFSHDVFSLAAVAIDAGNRCMAEIAGWPAGDMWLPSLSLWMAVFYVLGIGLAVKLAQKNRIYAAATVLLTVLVYGLVAVSEDGPQGTRLIVWDVGQGAASTLLLPGGKVLAVDVPGRAGSRFNGGTTVASGLRTMGLTHIDVLLITHAQSDHMGGALSLVQRLNQVGELWLAEVPSVRSSETVQKLIDAMRRQGGVVRWLKRGDVFDFFGSTARVLWPPKEFSVTNKNNASLVLRLDFPGGGSLLLPGDIEALAEDMLVSGVSHEFLAADVMLMPHHGSATSSTADFVAAVRPKIVIAQTGFANRYHFPHADVVQRYQKMGSAVWDTANGAVWVDFGVHGSVRAGYSMPMVSPKRKLALQWWQHFL
ncbi:MAG: DNA internalization-related competence protein ComEC/Rec2 [Mariprofundaceae bacterium]